jgi:type IV pilus assembly protein PilA
MKKNLQKGFSLVELLVVVAIIGVLAGVGIVGYQSYTESAKEKVAEANYNSIVRFVETELTLLNNGVQDKSGALFANTYGATAVGTAAFQRGNATNGSIADLKAAVEFHFSTNTGGLKFKNPFKATTTSQVKAISGIGTGAATDYVKGAIILRQVQASENGEASTYTPSAETATTGKIVAIYVGADQTAVPAIADLTTANKFKTKYFELK